MWLLATVHAVVYEACSAAVYGYWLYMYLYIQCHAVMKCLHPCLIACKCGWLDYDVTSCNHQCADKNGSCGVLKGVLNLQCKLLLWINSGMGSGAWIQ